MNWKTTFGIALVGFGLASCSVGHQSTLAIDAQLLAKLECEARHLKDERFTVANTIRLMEDSLARHRLPLSAAKSTEIDSVKASYTLRTGQLADKITKTMDSLFATNYHSSQERQQLDEEIEKVLQTNCQ